MGEVLTGVVRSTRSATREAAMKRQGKTSEFGRREFLRKLGLGATAVAASAPVAGPARAATESHDVNRKARYQPNSPLVKQFYSTARYPVK
jgi:hypothetical protein